MSEEEKTSKPDQAVKPEKVSKADKEKASKKGNFFKQVKAEFKRCSWPKKEELIRQSALVIVVSVVLGGIIAGIDWLIRLGLQAIGL